MSEEYSSFERQAAHQVERQTLLDTRGTISWMLKARSAEAGRVRDRWAVSLLFGGWAVGLVVIFVTGGLFDEPVLTAASLGVVFGVWIAVTAYYSGRSEGLRVANVLTGDVVQTLLNENAKRQPM